MSTVKVQNQTRLYIAFALFLTSIIAAGAISIIGNKSKSYWVMTRSISAGSQITSDDIELGKALLNYSSHHYIRSDLNPIGSIAMRSLYAGELLSAQAISDSKSGIDNEEIPLAIRSSDIPSQIEVGDSVNVYQVFDARSGETIKDPQPILTGAFLSSIDRDGGQFGGDIAITITLARELVPRMLAATGSGRIVIAASHG